MDAVIALYFRSLERQIATLQVLMARGFYSLGKTMAQIDDEITTLTADVAAQATVITSAETLLSGISTTIANAVAQALAAGATPEQLSALTAASKAIEAQTSGLAAAVAAAGPVTAA